MEWWTVPAAVMCAVGCNQALKALIEGDTRSLLRYGGFPSSHAALTAALTSAIGALEGPSGAFWLSLGFFALTLYDALRLRRHHKPRDILAGTLIGAAATAAVLLVAL